MNTIPKKSILFIISCILLFRCGNDYIFEKNINLPNSYWTIDDKKQFDFVISDTTVLYNIDFNIRNTLNYPYSRIFVKYFLYDSLNKELDNNLISAFLFDAKTGKPLGNSGLGDLFSNSFPLLKDYQFPNKGKYSIELTQMTRQDTLQGIITVGLSVAKNLDNKQ